MTVVNNEAYINWLRKKSDEKLNNDKLRLFEYNHEVVKRKLNEEKRRFFSDLCYMKWHKKKTEELLKKQMIMKAEKLKLDEQKIMAEKAKEIKGLKYNKWLRKKQLEIDEKKKEIEQSKEDKKYENEMKINEKQKAEMMWTQWSEKKMQEDKARRIMLQKQADEIKREKEDRKKLSDEIFKQWLKNSVNKPRPVKSNLGFASLSCPNVKYVNPVPWNSIIEDNVDNTTLSILYKRSPTSNTKKSNTTISTIEDENYESIRRTADWVRSVSKHGTSLPCNKHNIVNDNLTEISSTNSKDIVKFSHSAPVFTNKQVKNRNQKTKKGC